MVPTRASSAMLSPPPLSPARAAFCGARYAARAVGATLGSLGPRAAFATLKGKGLDGLTLEPDGRLRCAALDGVHVFDPAGQGLCTITLPYKPTSIAFAPAPSRLMCATTSEAAFVTALR